METMPAMTRINDLNHDHSDQIMKNLIKMVMIMVTYFGHCRQGWFPLVIKSCKISNLGYIKS